MKYLLLFALMPLSVFAQHKVDKTSTITIEGLVSQQLVFNYNAIKSFPQVALGDIAIKNHKGDEKNISKAVKGTLLKILIDSAGITTAKPKGLSEVFIVLIAADGYKNVYSWNEIFNTDIGNHLFVITEKDGETMDNFRESILVFSASDFNSGRRYLRGLERISVRKVE